MPIHFKCHACHRKLSVPTSKAGDEVLCPKCGVTIAIPTRSDLDAMAAMVTSTATLPPPELARFRFEEEGTRREQQAAPSTASPAPSEPAADQADKVALPRSVIYAQGLLLATIGLAAFLAGYLIGVGNRGPATGQPKVDAAGSIEVTGRISLAAGGDASPADQGALVIVLPKDAKPDDRIPVAGLKGGAADSGGNVGLGALESIGGAYQQVDEQGRFRIMLPGADEYWVLRISGSVDRGRGEGPSPADIEAMSRYFDAPEELIGRKEYAWESETLAGGDDLSHEFRRR